jgi:asparagine synthase (glutamine-hydrolysing)
VRSLPGVKPKKKSYVGLLWKDGLVPLFPRKIQGVHTFRPHLRLPPWYDKSFVVRMDLTERYLGPRDVFGFRLPSERDQAIGFLAIMRVVSKASHRARGRIEVSHPYLHRPLIEFLQAIPFEQRIRPGETRSLMRRALGDLMPEKILRRMSKKGPEEALFRAIAREWPRLKPIFEDARVCARGYMNAKALQIALEKARHGCERNSFALLQTISLELWLRALELRSPIAKNTADVEQPSTLKAAVSKANAQTVRQPRVHQGTVY